MFFLFFCCCFFEINHATSPKLYRSYYRHRSRDSFSPVCGIFLPRSPYGRKVRQALKVMTGWRVILNKTKKIWWEYLFKRFADCLLLKEIKKNISWEDYSPEPITYILIRLNSYFPVVLYLLYRAGRTFWRKWSICVQVVRRADRETPYSVPEGWKR